MEKRLGKIHQAQLHPVPAFEKGLEELKGLVARKKEEGFRFEPEDWDKMMSIVWVADRGHGIGLDRATKASALDLDTTLGETLRFEEFIDMDQFEDRPESSCGLMCQERTGIQRHPELDHQGGMKLAPITSNTGNDGTREEQDLSLFVANPTASITRDDPGRMEDLVAGGSFSRLPFRPRPRRRADSVISLSSGIESLPETETHGGRTRSRAGSDLTDVLAGISSYLDRPNRKRPSASPAPTITPQAPEHRLRRRTNRPIYSSKWHPMDSTRKQARLEDEAQQAADEANEELRSVRGLSTAPQAFLPASDGVRKEGGRDWWKWGENSLVGRMVSLSK